MLGHIGWIQPGNPASGRLDAFSSIMHLRFDAHLSFHILRSNPEYTLDSLRPRVSWMTPSAARSLRFRGIDLWPRDIGVRSAQAVQANSTWEKSQAKLLAHGPATYPTAFTRWWCAYVTPICGASSTRAGIASHGPHARRDVLWVGRFAAPHRPEMLARHASLRRRT